MKKRNDSEFTKVVEDMEKAVQSLNARKLMEKKRLKKLESAEDHRKAMELLRFQKEEQDAKKGDIKDKMGVIFSIGVLGALIVIPYYKKDPVNFWFYFVVGLCYLSFYYFYKHSK